MLSITPQALAIMRQVTAHPKLSPASGLRIACRDDSSEPVQVEAAHEPKPGDTVVVRDGARLFLGSGAAGRVEGGELDAIRAPDGRVRFVLRPAA